MRTLLPTLGALALALALPIAAFADSVVIGAAEGAAAGSANEAVASETPGLLRADQRPRFREYVDRERRTSHRFKTSLHYKQAVAVGVILPGTVELYDIPPEFGVRGYSYTIFNDRTVLLDPRTRVVVEVVD